MAKRLPTKKTVRAAIRASVPEGKLAKARILLAPIEQNKTPIGGFTQYGEQKGDGVVKIAAPINDDAFGITVRGHETRHASKHTLKRKKPMTPNEAIAGQMVDDVNIETLPVPNVKFAREYRRAHLAVAMKDLRDMVREQRLVKANPAKDTVEHRNANILRTVRTMAMTQHYGGKSFDRTDKGDFTPEFKTRKKAIEAYRDIIGHKMVSAIWQVIKLAKMARNRNKAISMLTGLLEANRPDMDDEDEPPSPRGGDVILQPVVEGSALDGHMKIVDLRPKTAFTAKQRQITRKYAPNGVIINTIRYVAAVVSGDGNGLFARRIRHKAGGTVVIDASGSMGVNRTSLKALCETIPTATVAYYSGGDGNGRGQLTVYALNGKRYSGELPQNSLIGGNAVDLPAVKWLFQQAKPWTLVSDLEFCGGVIGSEAVAHAIVDRATERGELTIHRSLDAAYEAFGGKGDLPTGND
jgi:hypothetical protein